MHVVSVLQIGDIHYPDVRNENVADLKDSALHGAILAHLAPTKFQKVFERIARVIEQRQPCGILICGDLTSRGNLPAYRECVAHLEKLLNLSKLDSGHWHVVPGNHDVARTDLAPGESPYPQLFLPLQEAWKNAAIGEPLPLETYRATTMPLPDSGISFYSLNSCIGCGEWRRLSDKLRGSLTAEIKKLIEHETDPEAKFNLLSEQLDSPLLSDAHLTALRDALQTLPPQVIPVVLAHHNMLPQAIPRTEIYTELLNAGALRSRFTALGRTVVYCHGHIHDDPVECIHSPAHPGSQLICISAPEIQKGFNLLQFFFNGNWQPLGLQITPYRMKPHGDIDTQSCLRISFVTLSQLISSGDTALLTLARTCSANGCTAKELRDSLGAPKPQFATLAEQLKELEWYGVIELRNRDTSDPKELRVQRISP